MKDESHRNTEPPKGKRRLTLNGFLSDLLIVAGAALLAWGALLIYLPAGCFVAGAELVALGWFVGAEGGDAD